MSFSLLHIEKVMPTEDNVERVLGGREFGRNLINHEFVGTQLQLVQLSSQKKALKENHLTLARM